MQVNSPGQHSGGTAGIPGLVPSWFLNAEITRSDVTLELDAMQAKGITEVMLHPRFGPAVEHLSDDWFGIVKWCVEEAGSRGMRLWIHHERDWPSGSAGMAAGGAESAFASTYLVVQAKPKADIGPPFFEPGRFLIGARLQGGRVTRTKLLTDPHSLRALDDGWLILCCHIKRDGRYIDTLSSGAVEFLKRHTYEEYRRRFPGEFGRTIRAVFSDEPSIYRAAAGCDDWTLPYTETLFQSFEERYGYPAAPNIPYLFFPGRNAAAFRADFWQHVADLVNTNFHANLAAWCKENGVLYAGQSHQEEPLPYQVRFTGDIFGAMKQMDIPAVGRLDEETAGRPWMSVIDDKIASSHAHAAGKRCVMSGSFGIGAWDATFVDLRKIVDWQFMHGVNVFTSHAAGPRTRESPRLSFTRSPMWADFDAFSAYVSGLSEALTGGRHLCRILILYPLSGFFAAYQPDQKTQEFECIDSFLNSLCIELEGRQLDYDLVDFQTLAAAAVENGHVCLGDESYSVLLVPYTPYMRPEEYTAIGRIASQVETYFFYRSGDPASANVPSQSNGVRFVATEDLPGFVMRLRHAVDDDIHLSGQGRQDILLLQREKNGHRIAFLVNHSEHERRITARFAGHVGLSRIDPQTRAAAPIHTRSSGGKTQAALHFGPHESMLIVAEEPGQVGDTDSHSEPEDVEVRGGPKPAG